MGERSDARAIFWGPPAADFLLLSNHLSQRGVALHRVETLEEMRAAIHKEAPDVVFTHLAHPYGDPVKLFYLLEVTAGTPPVILLGSDKEIPLYLEGMRRGAFDCVGLPLDEQELRRILRRALDQKVQLEVLTVGSR